MKRKTDWVLVWLRIVRRFWGILFRITRIPYVNNLAAHRELEAMKAINERWFGNNEH